MTIAHLLDVSLLAALADHELAALLASLGDISLPADRR
jgi:hypothetical protein